MSSGDHQQPESTDVTHGNESAANGVQTGQYGCHSYPTSEMEQKDETIRRLQRELLEYEMNFKEQERIHNVEKLHTNQTHHLAISDKINEIDKLKGERKVLTEQNEVLVNRVNELQATIHECNILAAANEVSKRDYDALMDRLTRAENERDAFRDNREKYHKENIQYEEKIREMGKEIDDLRQINEGLKDSLLTVQTDLRNKDKEVQFLKQRYECEKSRHSLPSITSPKGVITETHVSPTESGYQSGNRGSFQLSPSASLGSGARRSLDLSLPGPDEPRPKKRFITEPTKKPYCKNCRKILPENSECDFHMADPWSYKVWKAQPQVAEGSRPENEADHMYWPCCGKKSVKTPKGCKVLPKHEIVDPNEEYT